MCLRHRIIDRKYRNGEHTKVGSPSRLCRIISAGRHGLKYFPAGLVAQLQSPEYLKSRVDGGLGYQFVLQVDICCGLLVSDSRQVTIAIRAKRTCDPREGWPSQDCGHEGPGDESPGRGLCQARARDLRQPQAVQPLTSAPKTPCWRMWLRLCSTYVLTGVLEVRGSKFDA